MQEEPPDLEETRRLHGVPPESWPKPRLMCFPSFVLGDAPAPGTRGRHLPGSRCRTG